MGLWLASLSALACLALGEGAARLYLVRENKTLLAGALAAPPPIENVDEATLLDLIQLDPHPRILYTLRPSLSGIHFKRRPVRTNGAGFRGPEIPPAEPGCLTVLGIGDSSMFGHGVGDGEEYPRVLETLLVKRVVNPQVRVINTGVPGYNTVQEVATLEERCLDYEPDVVVLGLLGNDYIPPAYVRDPLDPWALNRSELLRRCRTRLAQSSANRTARAAGLAHFESWAQAEDVDMYDYAESHPELAGRPAFLAALDRLRELSIAHEFQVVVLLPFEFGPASLMLQDCAERGFVTNSLHEEVVRYVEAESGRPFHGDDLKRSALVVSHRNLHPSDFFHRRIAERLAKVLVTHDLVQVKDR